jgi:hypothetical protein
MLKSLTALIAPVCAAFFLSVSALPAHALDAKSDCEAKAVSQEGKPLAGAAKNSFMKKCTGGADAAPNACEAKAVSKEGKPLAGAAKASFMKKCAADTK